MLFFVLQVTIVTTYFSDNIIVAQVLGSPAVPQYAVPAKLFGFIVTVVSMLVWALWPAYGEAMTRGDIDWVKATLVRTLLLTLALTAGPALILVVSGRRIIEAWVGGAVDPSLWLLAGLALWAIVNGVGGTLAIFLNGAGILRFQVVCSSVMFVVALPLKILMAEAGRRRGALGGGYRLPHLHRDSHGRLRATTDIGAWSRTKRRRTSGLQSPCRARMRSRIGVPACPRALCGPGASA